MAKTFETTVAVIGIDIGKNSFHVVGLDRRGAIVLRQKWSRGQVETRLNLPPLSNRTLMGSARALLVGTCPTSKNLKSDVLSICRETVEQTGAPGRLQLLLTAA